jgi:amidohydrolase
MHSPISDIIKKNIPDFTEYESLYKRYHSNPELSNQESETAASISAKLSSFGVKTIHREIGGHGVAAVIENGPGKIILLRSDIDALPVEEKTGLEYASKKTATDADGKLKPVMHACGHDMHITVLLAATELMMKAKEEWSGTLILCFQPAEEKGSGAVS